MITGATGQIGCQLLYQLLRRTTGSIFCIVRASNDSVALDRLLEALRQRTDLFCHFTAAEVRQRIHPLSMTGNNFPSLSSTQLEQLIVCSVSTVYHVAAHVSWSRPYELLRQSNVEFTCDLLNLCTRHAFRLVYISTVGVASSLNSLDGDEQRDLSSLLANTGYVQTKTVAERFVRQAINAGSLRGVVIRPAMITGHSELGACQPSDYVACYLRGVVELGCYLDDDQHYQDMLPVDIAARQIFDTAQAFAADVFANGQTIALADQHALSYAELGRIVSDWHTAQLPSQPPLTPVDYNTFCRTINEHPGCALTPFLQTILLPTGMQACPSQLSTVRTNSLFARAGIEEFRTSMDARRGIIARSLRYLIVGGGEGGGGG